MRKTVINPEAMENWIEAQIESGRYDSDSEYVRDLIRWDQDLASWSEGTAGRDRREPASGISERPLKDILTEARVRAGNSAAGADG